MSTPRNRAAFELGKAMHAEIRAMLLAHPAGASPLTAKRIRPRLSRDLSERQIQQHVAAIREEFDRPRETNPNLSLTALHSRIKPAHSAAMNDETKIRERSYLAPGRYGIRSRREPELPKEFDRFKDFKDPPSDPRYEPDRV